MAGIEQAFEKFVTRVSSRERSPAEEPLSNYKSYSENELLSSLDAKMPNLEIVDNELVNMPMYKPMDVLPPRSRPVMPSKEYLERRLFLDLAKGGRVIKRKRYADGGTYPSSVTAPSGIQFELLYSPFSGKPFYQAKYDPSRTDLTYYGIDPEEFFKTVMTTGMSTPTTTEIPTVDPFSGQQVSAQDQSEFLDIPDQVKSYIASLSSAKDKQDVIDLYRRKPVSVDEIPTVDPFSGQQVSAQEQAAFTQPQPEIFPTSNNIANTLNVGSSDPLTNILGSQVGNLSYSEMNALRNRSPNVLSSNVGANLLQALGTGLKDFAYVGDKLGPDYYKNLSGNFFENIKNLDKGFSYDPTYMGADKTGRLDYYKQGIKSLLGMNTPGSNVGGGTPGMRYAIEQISPYLSKTVGPALNILGSAPVTAFGILDTLTGPANAPEVGKGPEYFRQQLQLPENSPVSRFNQVQDPRSMMAYGGRVSMSNGGLTKTVPPVRGPSPQGVESLFRRRYN
jgi:hypothetical protein